MGILAMDNAWEMRNGIKVEIKVNLLAYLYDTVYDGLVFKHPLIYFSWG